MMIDQMIKELQAVRKEHGNVPVLIVDGYNCRFYSGEYEIKAFAADGIVSVDIGIGGLEDE